MVIDALYRTYFQKSKIFLYPLLDIKRGASVVPEQTYLSWEGFLTTEDIKLIALYPKRTDREYLSFEKNVLLKHSRTTDFVELSDTQVETNSGNYVYVDSYLFPEKYFQLYADLLDTSEELLRSVGELCSPPDLDKENLVAVLENKKILG